ncbi:unnamed protein product [Discula destructiva]
MSASRRVLRTNSSTSPHNVLHRSTRSQASFAGLAKAAAAAQTAPSAALTTSKPLTTLQEANPRNLPDLWFNQAFPYRKDLPPLGQGQNKPPDERKVKLGKTLRILQERLPTLLQSPLPQDILAPNISLHLFPSTHPHLPAVSGRVAYIAALWTSPIAWNSMPIIGDVRLEILSERMLHEPGKRVGAGAEQLVVRWRTTGGWRLPLFQHTTTAAATAAGDEGAAKKGFTGLFIFEFDGEGRVLSHTIETVQSDGEWESGVGAKFVGLTDWLFGGMRGGREGCPAFEIQSDEHSHRRR